MNGTLSMAAFSSSATGPTAPIYSHPDPVDNLSLAITAAKRLYQAFSGAQLRKNPTSPGIPPGKLTIMALSL
jgi:hypothetical protein